MARTVEVTLQPDDGRVTVILQADDAADFRRLVAYWTGGEARAVDDATAKDGTVVSRDELPPVAPSPPALRERACPICGEPVDGPPNKKYCSAKCRQQAKRDKRKPNNRKDRKEGTEVPDTPAPDDGAILPNGSKAILAAARNAARQGIAELYELLSIFQTATGVTPDQAVMLREEWGDETLVSKLQTHKGVLEAVRKGRAYAPPTDERRGIMEIEFDDDPTGRATVQPVSREREVRAVKPQRHGGFSFGILPDRTPPNI